MISLNDVLLAMSNIPVDDPIAEIWGQGLQGGYKIIEYTGSLPITINANGDALIDYRIYGADGGVGEATENLFNIDRERSDIFTLDPKYYIYGGNAVTKDTSSSNIHIVVTNKLEVSSNSGSGAGFIIPVLPNTTYTLSYDVDLSISDNITSAVLNFIDNDKKLGTYWGVYGNITKNTFTTESTAKYVYIVFRTVYRTATYSNITLVEGSTAPESYIPYGYKLPMVTVDQLFDKNTNWFDNVYKDDSGNERTQGRASYTEKYMPCRGNQTLRIDHADGNAYVSFRLYFYDSQKQWIKRTEGYTGNDISLTIVTPANAAYFQVQYEYRNTYYNINTLMIYTTSTDTPVYIGENQLDAGEYVSFSEQKIYRDVGGTLTPTDPPVPLPDIPTIDGTTVIDYDGDPKPSQMYVKYKGKG